MASDIVGAWLNRKRGTSGGISNTPPDPLPNGPGLPPGAENWTQEEWDEYYASHPGTGTTTAQPQSPLSYLPAVGAFVGGNAGPIETPDRPYATQPAAMFDKGEEERKRREAMQMQALMGKLPF